MSPDGNAKSPAFRIYSALIVFASFATTVLLLPRIYLNFKNQYFLTHVEGVWLACAHDFLHGVFYRPLFGPLGYGGTRYFPLYFVFTVGFQNRSDRWRPRASRFRVLASF